MKTRSVAAATIVALAIAAGLPTFNWAKDATSEPDPAFIPEGAEKPEWAEKPERAEMRERAITVQDQAQALREQGVEIRKTAEKAAIDMKRNAEYKFRYAFTGSKKGAPLDVKIHDAAEQVQNAKDDESKAKASRELTSLLDEYFEQDMNARGQELKDIQARLERLQAQLDRRREKKQEIIDLQVKVALNEADGLGFYTQSQPGMFNFRVPAPVVVDTIVPTLGPPIPIQPTARPTLEQGAKGELVKTLQLTLNARVKPSLNIAVDSDFGPETKSAVEKFQTQNGLKPTGVVDADTWKALETIEQFIKPASLGRSQ